MRKALWGIVLVTIALAIILAACVPRAETQVQISEDETLDIKQWTNGGTVWLMRYIDRETGVVCYHYGGDLACVKLP